MKNFRFLVMMILAVIIMPSCRRHSPRPVNPAFRQYIQAFTSGVISSRSTIKIRLTTDFVDSALFNHPIEEKYSFLILSALSISDPGVLFDFF